MHGGESDGVRGGLDVDDRTGERTRGQNGKRGKREECDGDQAASSAYDRFIQSMRGYNAID